MLIRYDFHTHSSCSFDSDAPMRDMVERAVSLGLEGICFTEHLDRDYPKEDGEITLDIPSYREQLLSLREEFQGKIEVLFGIELGMQPHLGPYYQELTSSFPFDFVAASQHLVYGRDPWYPRFWKAHPDKAQVLRDYFSAALQNLQGMEDFDTCTHLDYIVRYAPGGNGQYSAQEYFDVLDPLFTYLIRKDKCLEVNTAPRSKGFPFANPSTQALRRYYELGGRNLTIGSDAHEPGGIAGHFDETAALLREIGFTHCCIFRARKRSAISLQESRIRHR